MRGGKRITMKEFSKTKTSSYHSDKGAGRVILLLRSATFCGDTIPIKPTGNTTLYLTEGARACDASRDSLVSSSTFYGRITATSTSARSAYPRWKHDIRENLDDELVCFDIVSIVYEWLSTCIARSQKKRSR